MYTPVLRAIIMLICQETRLSNICGLERRWKFLKHYKTPNMEVVYFETEDVIATSFGEIEVPGGGDDLWEEDD